MTLAKPKKPATVKEPAKADRARYFEGVGGRKTAMARVRLYTKKGDSTVNGKTIEGYFPSAKQRMTVVAPFVLMGASETMHMTVHVRGGGIMAQADAVRHGLARALVKFNEEYRKRLRKAGYMTRDAREVERKKYGLKKARRAPQWAKR